VARPIDVRALFAIAAVAALATAPLQAHGHDGAPWSRAHAAIARDVARGRPFVTLVIVPLCDDALIDCGGGRAGHPDDLGHNVYWGAVFGQKRFFDRKASAWSRTFDALGSYPVLEHVAFTRKLPPVWEGGSDASEQIVVFEAYDGRAIDRALGRFFEVAAGGASVTLGDVDHRRTLAVHVVGWAGHNRLMDGVPLPKIAPKGTAIPSFVMACESESYFGAPLRKLGSAPLLTTRTRMAPEGYVVDALVRALGDGASLDDVRSRTIDAYATWQRLERRAASGVFADASPR
jgi:hypothetical protein